MSCVVYILIYFFRTTKKLEISSHKLMCAHTKTSFLYALFFSLSHSFPFPYPQCFFLLLFFKTCSFSTPLMKSSLHFCTHKTSQTLFFLYSFLSPPVVLFLSKFVFFILFEKQQKKI